jgi:peptidoglycan/xylan/chitin deacetylase (PgdA/CDA1 family)
MAYADPVTLPVLMYHSVSTVDDGPMRQLAVPPQRLREQLSALSDAGYALVGLTEALQVREKNPDEQVVAVTFDDGYLDFLTAGLDVLRDVGASATLYICPGHTGPGAAVMASTSTFGPLLSWDQIREVAAAGVEIGNHSLLHHPLDVQLPRALDREIRDSKDQLEQQTGAAVPSFAYPHGYHSGRVRAVVARYGHDHACEVGRALYQPPGARFAIPRLYLTPDHDGPATLAAVRSGHPGLVPRLRRRARPAWRAVRWTALHGFGRTLT